MTNFASSLKNQFAGFLFAGCLLALSGCASMDGIKAVPGQDGLYRTTSQMPEGVLRNSNEEVITSEDEAKKALKAINSPLDLIKNSRTDRCSVKKIHRAKVAQLRAEQQLRAQEWRSAMASLEEAHRECGEMHFISAQNYYLAVAQQGLGEIEAAKISATRFLKYASAYRPALFVQGKSSSLEGDEREWVDQQREFKSLRESAQAFVASGTPLEWRTQANESAKFYPNQFFRPGGNLRDGGFVLPAIGFGGAQGTLFGLTGYRSWGEYGAGLSYVSSSTTGSYFGAKLRKNLYESERRDWDVETFIVGRTNKTYSYRLTSYGQYQDVKVLESSFDPGVGAGATKRFVPEFGLTSQLVVYADGINDEVDFVSSLYTFYDLNSTFSVNAGWLYNRPMVSVSILFVHLGYNLREEEFNAIIQGFDF